MLMLLCKVLDARSLVPVCNCKREAVANRPRFSTRRQRLLRSRQVNHRSKRVLDSELSIR